MGWIPEDQGSGNISLTSVSLPCNNATKKALYRHAYPWLVAGRLGSAHTAQGAWEWLLAGSPRVAESSCANHKPWSQLRPNRSATNTTPPRAWRAPPAAKLARSGAVETKKQTSVVTPWPILRRAYTSFCMIVVDTRSYHPIVERQKMAIHLRPHKLRQNQSLQ